jgi:NADPH:quinone reductase-like Zn-dependent oxidoreductase
MRDLGADHVVDYTQEDYTQSSKTYDLIIDVVGKLSVSRRLKLLKADGIYYLAFAKPSHILLSLWTSLTSKKRVKIQAADQTKADLNFLKDSIESGALEPVVDRVFPLEQVPEAHRYVEVGGKVGNVCIRVGEGMSK